MGQNGPSHHRPHILSRDPAMTFLPDFALLLALFARLFRAVRHARARHEPLPRQDHRGRAKAGMASMLGAMTGCCVHTLLAAFGLSALLAASATAFTVLKVVGALYLLWMAVEAVRHGSALRLKDEARGEVSSWRPSFLLGVGINLTNPKIVLFFVTFLPQFVQADDPHAADKLVSPRPLLRGLLGAPGALCSSGGRAGRRALRTGRRSCGRSTTRSPASSRPSRSGSSWHRRDRGLLEGRLSPLHRRKCVTRRSSAGSPRWNRLGAQARSGPGRDVQSRSSVASARSSAARGQARRLLILPLLSSAGPASACCLSHRTEEFGLAVRGTRDISKARKVGSAAERSRRTAGPEHPRPGRGRAADLRERDTVTISANWTASPYGRPRRLR